MAKELTHRASELKVLGWSQQDLARYIDLWDYRQRWGAINLEREDRQFLRKAELALPVITTSKPSVKKPIKEKSYYCRLVFFLNQMKEAEESLEMPSSSKGLWPILLEEELRLLDYYEPVLGLPDTLKSKLLIPFREQVISALLVDFKDSVLSFDFDFNTALDTFNLTEKKKWQPLRDGIEKDEKLYPVIDADHLAECRTYIRNELLPKIRDLFPSLAETSKPNPPDEWIPESKS